jgi:hypothetical protein
MCATMLAMSCQLMVCQMPYSFSRMAGAVGRCGMCQKQLRKGRLHTGPKWVTASSKKKRLVDFLDWMLDFDLTPSCRFDDNLRYRPLRIFPRIFNVLHEDDMKSDLYQRRRPPTEDELANIPWLPLLLPKERERAINALRVGDAEKGILCAVLGALSLTGLARCLAF